MKRSTLFSVGVLLLVLGIAPLAAQLNQVPRTLMDFAGSTLQELGRDPTIVSSVAAQNTLGRTLSEVNALDATWQRTEGIDRFMYEYLTNECTFWLLNFEAAHPYIVETFAMDSLGAIVGLTEKTSDFWQGDEDKFTQSYRDGDGGIHYGDVEFDDSSGEIVVQISVPVVDAGQAIGAITFSISMDRWEQR